jgi:glycosyltransferase involved in cell wall biosynthesis
MGRIILICEFDVFKLVGGGQTVYQNIIRKCPEDTFYYLASNTVPVPGRPHNAIPIVFHQFYGSVADRIPPMQDHFFYVYRDSMDMARSVYEALGPIKLDVVDTPDYRQNGIFLRHALEAHGISVGAVALALHGVLSSAFLGGWAWTDDPRRSFAQLRMREHLQFRSVDIRYAISEFYADRLRRYAPLPINMLDPLAVIRDTQPIVSPLEERPPDLVFVGRRERRKGPDLFLDIAWWCPAEAYRRLVLIGDEGVNHQGMDSRHIVAEVARHRRLNPEVVASMSQNDLRLLVRQKTVVLLPSRYDQFNLVALEALLDGCPTVISWQAGVSRFIEERLPELSWLLVDIGCDRGAAAPTREILENYDRKRSQIVDALRRAKLAPDPESVKHIYDAADQYDHRARGVLHDLADRFAMFTITPKFEPAERPDASRKAVIGSVTMPIEPAGTALVTVPPAAPPGFRVRARELAKRSRILRGLVRRGRASVHDSIHLARRARNFARSPRAGMRRWLKSRVDSGEMTLVGLNGPAVRQVAFLEHQVNVFRNLITFGERTDEERKRKLSYLGDLIADRRIDRVWLFREMARLERLRGRDLIAATYGLRIIRWLGRDQFRLLPFIEETLNAHGFTREAEAAHAMYADPAHADERCRAFLDDQLARHRVNADRPWEEVDDRRGQRQRRVSIIVSLYNAATKLPTFWRMLQQQTMVRSGDAEIVFVDSGSPSNEYAVFLELSTQAPLPAVYARSKERETIQMAWNRGLTLSSGAYLTFLGVDEGVHPECFDILARELDRDASLDWVMADSVVTSVDRAGRFERDIMMYDRTGYRHDWHYLDCTFLSYVGGLYRRSIHDRFGYYDESFRAAGDTEFKNRILPFIRSKYVSRPLGVFNNYPEERTTQHPRAEIEDLRAWYLHRTPAGAAYAFDRRPAQDVLALLKDTLGYRKCYCRHISMDLDLADALATHLARRPDGAKWGQLQAGAHEILRTLRGFELLPYSNDVRRDQLAFVLKYRSMLSLSRKLGCDLGLKESPEFDVFHDNRYEQHWWFWGT